MGKYVQILENEYQEQIENGVCFLSRLEFIGEEIFNFITNDSEATERMSLKMLEVIESILNKTTYEYIKENYDNYLIMVNMPFLIDKLEYGSSIRGAWFDFSKEYIISEEIIIKEFEIDIFMKQLIEWCNKY